MAVHYDIVTKANLQYFDGKVKRELTKKGEIKNDHVLNDWFSAFNRETGEATWFNSDERKPMFNLQAEEAAAQAANPTTLRRISDSGYGVNGDHSLDITDLGNGITIAKNTKINPLSANIPTKEYVDSVLLTISSLKMATVDTSLFSSLDEFLDTDSWTTEEQNAFKQEVINHSDTIYLYKVGTEHYEYIPFVNPPGANPNPPPLLAWEFVGSTKQDLTGYVKEADIPETDNDYIDGLFLRNLEPGIYNASGKLIKSWDELTSTANNVTPIFVADSTTFYGYNDSLYADQIFDAGVTLIFPSNITTFNGSAPSANTPTNMFLIGLEFLQTVLFKGQMSGLDSYRIFEGCTSLQKVYSVNNLPDSEKEVTSAKFIVI